MNHIVYIDYDEGVKRNVERDACNVIAKVKMNVTKWEREDNRASRHGEH